MELKHTERKADWTDIEETGFCNHGSKPKPSGSIKIGYILQWLCE